MDIDKSENKFSYKIFFDEDDVLENVLREKMPEILDILLIDRTTSKKNKNNNIIWGNENYLKYGHINYSPRAQIKPNLITGIHGDIIKPRASKSKDIQDKRAKNNAEVFTPVWVIKNQIDDIDRMYINDSIEEYSKRLWLEITCGEAPYMTTRYDTNTGILIPVEERVGFVDRKLKRICNEINSIEEWNRLVEISYKTSYGYEWNGDSLLIARENLLYTYRDFYVFKWNEEPLYEDFKKIAEIISYNIFQMDGIKYIIPFSDEVEENTSTQISFFDDYVCQNKLKDKENKGKRVKIMNWDTGKMNFFK